MRTTLIKTKFMHIWVSGSMVDPFANVWCDSKSENGYSAVNIFPHIWKSWIYIEGTEPNQFRYYWNFKMANWTPKLIKWYLRMRIGWNNWTSDYDNATWDENGYPNGCLPKPSFLKYIYIQLKREYQIKHCKHNFEVDSNITPDHGSEDIYCPKCGYSQHICYY